MLKSESAMKNKIFIISKYLLITVYIIGTLNTQEPYIYFKMQAITSVTQFY